MPQIPPLPRAFPACDGNFKTTLVFQPPPMDEEPQFRRDQVVAWLWVGIQEQGQELSGNQRPTPGGICLLRQVRVSTNCTVLSSDHLIGKAQSALEMESSKKHPREAPRTSQEHRHPPDILARRGYMAYPPHVPLHQGSLHDACSRSSSPAHLRTAARPGGKGRDRHQLRGRAPEAALIPIYLQCAPVPHARLAADCSPLTANVANDGRWWEGAAHSCW